MLVNDRLAQQPSSYRVILSDQRESKDPYPENAVITEFFFRRTDSSTPLRSAQNDMRFRFLLR